VLYPDGRVSPTQEAQLTMFNAEAGNVRAYAVGGSFDDCHRVTREAFGDRSLRERVRLTSANSVNVGRLLPQMVYYFHAVAEIARRASDGGRAASGPTGLHGAPWAERASSLRTAPRVGEGRAPAIVVCTPSGNFGNLTAGLMARRAGLSIGRFVAATNVNDVVPEYLSSGRFVPRASVPTIANAMDVGNPSNFERIMWLYGGDLAAMRQDMAGSRHTDDEVRMTIRKVFDTRGYLLDPHSAIAYLGLTRYLEHQNGTTGVLLATAHPAKFREIVEPVIRRAIETPAPLAEALAKPRHILRIEATKEALVDALDS
jgi:threonine synthase